MVSLSDAFFGMICEFIYYLADSRRMSGWMSGRQAAAYPVKISERLRFAEREIQNV